MKYIKVVYYNALVILLIFSTLYIYNNKQEINTLPQSNQLEKSISLLYNNKHTVEEDINFSLTQVESQALLFESIPEHIYTEGIVQSTVELDIKGQPSYSGAILGTIRNNAKVSILYEIEEWVKIQSGSVTGYIESKYILQGEEAQILLDKNCSIFVKSQVSILRLYSSPDENSSVITLLSNNVEYPMYNEESGYYKLAVDSDLVGYVRQSDTKLIRKYTLAKSNEEIQLAKEKEEKLLADAQSAYNALIALQNRNHTSGEIEDATRTAMVSFAKQYLGNPYLWGGTSLTNGIDCSAYVRAVYDHVGIHLTRTTREQIKQGREITIKEVKPGDLFFYAYNNGYVHHVAMYIGNGELIHAAGKDYGIIISPVDYREPYKIKTYLN